MNQLPIGNMENNKFADIIYKKPTSFFKERLYYFREVKPIIDDLKSNPMTFDDMCEFSDFIKILEMVFFYHNDKRYIKEIDTDTRIVTDNNIKNNFDKNLTILKESEMVTIVFNMSRYETDENTSISKIEIACLNEFGKKINTLFKVVNGEIADEALNKNTHNLLYNINKILNDTVISLFLKYYKIS